MCHPPRSTEAHRGPPLDVRPMSSREGREGRTLRQRRPRPPPSSGRGERSARAAASPTAALLGPPAPPPRRAAHPPDTDDSSLPAGRLLVRRRSSSVSTGWLHLSHCEGYNDGDLLCGAAAASTASHTRAAVASSAASSPLSPPRQRSIPPLYFCSHVMSASSPLSPPSTARTSTCRGAAEMRPRCGRYAAEMHRAPAGSRPRRRSSHGAVGLPASAPPPPAALSAAARARQAQTRPAAAAPAPDPRAECPLCVCGLVLSVCRSTRGQHPPSCAHPYRGRPVWLCVSRL